jgi:hypothetical protein
MPIHLTTQKDLRAVQRLPFCYLCADVFQAGEVTTRDHVPPSGLFDEQDRDFPLILPTHERCNHRQSADDEVIAQVVGVLHGKPVIEDGRRPRLGVGSFDDGSFGYCALGLGIRGIIWRWVRGFHSALYQKPVGRASFSVYPPLPEGRGAGNQIEPVPMPEVVPHLVREIRCNRLTQSLDSIVCRRQRCRYECLWTQADGGQWFCIWALDLDGWSELGDVTHFERRGCVGTYRLQEQPVPAKATIGTKLQFDIRDAACLDPFDDAG